MQISQERIKQLSKTASIELNSDEIDSLQEDLKKILTYAESLESIDTEGVEPLISPIDQHLCNIVREDIPDMSEESEEADPAQRLLLQGAPDQVARMIRVPSIMS